MKHFFFAFLLTQICIVSPLIKHHKSPHYHKLNLPRHHPIDAWYRMHTVPACMAYLFAVWVKLYWMIVLLDLNLTASLPLTTWPKTFLCVKQNKLKPYNWNWIRPTTIFHSVIHQKTHTYFGSIQCTSHTFIELVMSHIYTRNLPSPQKMLFSLFFIGCTQKYSCNGKPDLCWC